MRGFGFQVWSGVSVLDLFIYYSQPDKVLFVFTKLTFQNFGGEGSNTVGNKYANFLSLTFSKSFTRQGIILVEINGAELRLKGRTMNIK